MVNNEGLDPRFTPREIHEWDTREWPTDDAEAAKDMYEEFISEGECPFAWLLWPGNKTKVTETK